MEEILGCCELLKQVGAEQPSIRAQTCASQLTMQVNAGSTVLRWALKIQQGFQNNECCMLLICLLRVASSGALF